MHSFIIIDPQPPIIMSLVPIYEVRGELKTIRIILHLNNQVRHAPLQWHDHLLCVPNMQGYFQDENGRNIMYILRVKNNNEVFTQIKIEQTQCDMSGQCKLELDASAWKHCLDNVVMSYKIETLAVNVIGESMINVHPHEIGKL